MKYLLMMFPWYQDVYTESNFLLIISMLIICFIKYIDWLDGIYSQEAFLFFLFLHFLFWEDRECYDQETVLGMQSHVNLRKSMCYHFLISF